MRLRLSLPLQPLQPRRRVSRELRRLHLEGVLEILRSQGLRLVRRGLSRRGKGVGQRDRYLQVGGVQE